MRIEFPEQMDNALIRTIKLPVVDCEYRQHAGYVRTKCRPFDMPSMGFSPERWLSSLISNHSVISESLRQDK